MKETLTVLVKVLVWLGFITNSGCFHAIWHSFDKDKSPTFKPHGVEIKKQDHSTEELFSFSGQMSKWEDAKAKKAQDRVDHGGRYSADDYFADLREFVDSVKKFGQQPVGLFMTQLLVVDQRSKTEEEIEVARNKHLPELHAEEVEREKNSPPVGESLRRVACSVWKWWLDWYLSSLWLAFFLFLAWRYEADEYSKLRLRNPVSFIISLILYPFVIGYNMRKWFRRIHAEVEIRRGKDKIFSLLSEDEIGSIRNFAQSKLSFRQFREELKLKGYVPKYSIISVLFVMVIMAFLPKTVLPQESVVDERVVIYQVTNNYDYFHPDEAVSSTTFERLAEAIVFADLPDVPIRDIAVVFWRFLVSSPCKGHYRGLDPVPLVIKSNSFGKTFNNQIIVI